VRSKPERREAHRPERCDMKTLPTDPFSFRDRVFDALCNDLAEGKGVERTEALRHISKQHRDGGGNASCGNPPPSNS
jgi:hypothetical protein